MSEQMNEASHELMNEPGSIGQEQNPVEQKKNDKQPWTYAADEVEPDFTWWQRLSNFFKGGT